MSGRLAISVGMHSECGAKGVNQDFHGLVVPTDSTLASKGVAIGIADGISSSKVSRVASESAVKTFLSDYYCTSDAWSVKTSAYRVLAAVNSWLHAQTRRSPFAHDRDQGYVCTFSGMILKSTIAHLFHLGDSRIYRVNGRTLEQLTRDHRLVVSEGQSYLSRALGMSQDVEIDYAKIALQEGDLFILATDGLYEPLAPQKIIETIRRFGSDLDAAARQLVADALATGHGDDATVQILRIDALPVGSGDDFVEQALSRAVPAVPEPGQILDGYRIERILHASSRSHVFLATDLETNTLATLKVPSVDLRDQPGYLHRLMMEDWIARRLSNPHVVRPAAPTRQRAFLYVATEWIEGQTLAQWMLDNPQPDLDVVRGIVEQIGVGLRAFHRKEMIHQDLRPANVMIDRAGTVKIIDFGSTRVAGVIEASPSGPGAEILGTTQYAAPEYFVGEEGTFRSDIFSLAAIAYHMLTGRLPYGPELARARTKAHQRKLSYRPACDDKRHIPVWVDRALEKALDIEPARRHAEVSELLEDIRRPNPAFAGERKSLLDRDPKGFWKVLSLVFALLALIQWALHMRGLY